MSDKNSSLIVSSQTGPHQNLEKIVRRHAGSEYQDTIPQYAIDAFEKSQEFVLKQNKKVVLDSGCGTGESAYHLAKSHPDLTVIGLDKSKDRLDRSHTHGVMPENLMLIQCDCIHFWRLLSNAHWEISHQYLLYPNPWPKPGHLQRRWHAHPVFPDMMSLGGCLTMRTNWEVYAKEFVLALNILGKSNVSFDEFQVENAITAFERKYTLSGHKLFEVRAVL